MKAYLQRELLRATALTFDRLAFIFAAPTGVVSSVAEPAFEAAVEVDFRGDLEGRLILAARGGILPLILRNILGKGAESNKELGKNPQLDALGELASVITGNLLLVLAAEQRSFRIDPPRPIPAQKYLDAKGKREPTAEVQIQLEHGRADIHFYLEGPVPQAPGPAEPAKERA